MNIIRSPVEYKIIYFWGHCSRDENLGELDCPEDLLASIQKRYLETLGPLLLLKINVVLSNG